MHVWDLVGINGISWVLLVHGCQQAVHPQDHILPLWPPIFFYVTFRRFYKIAESFVMYVCLSVLMEQLGSHWRILIKFGVWVLFKICSENLSFIKFWQEQQVIYINSYENSWHVLNQFFLEWETFQTDVVEKFRMHILCSIPFFFDYFEVCEIMCKYIVNPDRPQMTYNMVQCWVTKVTNTHQNMRYLLLF
jgi:hypothetical protein